MANNSTKGQVAMPTGITAALAGDTTATVQLRSDAAGCFWATVTDVKIADSDFFKAKNRPLRRFLARNVEVARLLMAVRRRIVW